MDLLTPKYGLFIWALIGLGIVVGIAVAVVVVLGLRKKDKRSQKATKE